MAKRMFGDYAGQGFLSSPKARRQYLTKQGKNALVDTSLPSSHLLKIRLRSVADAILPSLFSSIPNWRTKMYSHVPLKIRGTSFSIALLMGVGSLSVWPIEGHTAATLPTLPQTYIDTTYSAPTGGTCTAANSSAFQACLNDAALNSTIVLQAGTTYTGPFTLPNKTSGSGWIYIVSSNLANLPAAGNRVSPSHSANMPKITGPSLSSAIITATTAHHYRFVGIEIAPVSNNFVYDLVEISGGSSLGTLPHDIVFDRCYIHGDPSQGGRRGVAMNGNSIAVIDSYVSDFKENGADTQALWSYNGAGPFKIVNNYLEAAGENVMFGGADPDIANLIPSDIEIKRNYFFKPLTWRGLTWDVKNLFELKNAARVLIEGNVFENNWADAQNGFSILFTPRNQDGGCNWCTVVDVMFRNNIVKNVGGGFNLYGGDNANAISKRVAIVNNLLVGVTTTLSSDNGRVFQVTDAPEDYTVSHNTAFDNQYVGFHESNPRAPDFDMKNNIVTSCWSGTGTSCGTETWNTHFTSWTCLKNAWIGGNASVNPPNNFFPANIAAVGFVDYAGGNYRLSASSPYKNAGTDSKDLGADIDAIEAAIAGGGGGSTTLCTTLSAPKNLQIVQ